MIALPVNDLTCLETITQEMADRVRANDPAIREIAERHMVCGTGALAAWIRSLPQRDDSCATAPLPHFHWRRWKGFWRGQYGEGHDPGLTYERDSVDVAVRVTPPSRALDEEMRVIRRLKPRDNVIGQPERADEAVPF